MTIQPGGPAIVPEQVVAAGGAQFGIDWLPSLLAVRDRGIALVNIAQVFAHSGMREIAFKSSGIRGAADLRGRKVAVWFAGNEFELLATLEKYGIDRRRDVTLVPQPFDMRLLLDKKVDAAAAMTYNEYHQVLDAGVKPEGASPRRPYRQPCRARSVPSTGPPSAATSMARDPSACRRA